MYGDIDQIRPDNRIVMDEAGSQSLKLQRLFGRLRDQRLGYIARPAFGGQEYRMSFDQIVRSQDSGVMGLGHFHSPDECASDTELAVIIVKYNILHRKISSRKISQTLVCLICVARDRVLMYPALMSADDRSTYFRPIIGPAGRQGGWPVSGGPSNFFEIEVLTRGAEPQVLPVEAVDALWPQAVAALGNASARRSDLLGMSFERPRIMGILNVTPDSFSDGGAHVDLTRAVDRAMEMAGQGADLIDIGGESTRPGAETVPVAEEIDRVLPVIDALISAGCPVPLSIDTRKAEVAKAALNAGAQLFNDVSALGYDTASMTVGASAKAVCLMHAQGSPETMQGAAAYDDVLLDVFDYLSDRIAIAEAAGISRDRIIVDPGIGFGKTLTHNVTLIRGLALFLTLGCPIMLGVSRKRFIGTLSGVEDAAERGAGSVAAGLLGIENGAHILRVHDVAQTVQAVRVWQAIRYDNAAKA